MNPIRTLDQLVQDLKDQPSRRLAVAAGHDPNTIQAAARAAREDIAQVTLVGDAERIGELCREFELDPGVFTILDEPDTVAAGARAVQLVRSGEADVLMKGLIATSDFLRAYWPALIVGALIEAARSRFRPIVLTSLTTTAGLFPMLFETSTQALFLVPMAIALSFGTVASTFVVLLLIPVVVIMSGALPARYPEDTYARLVRLFRELGSCVVLDTSGPALANTRSGAADCFQSNPERRKIAPRSSTHNPPIITPNHGIVAGKSAPRECTAAAIITHRKLLYPSTRSPPVLYARPFPSANCSA